MFKKKQDLKKALNATKEVEIGGILFEIKKLDLFDYLNGSKVMLSMFETYKVGDSIDKPFADNKIRKHFVDVYMSGVIKPRLSRKNEGANVFVEEIFKDPEIASALYNEIIDFTYGKKKLQNTFLGKS